MRIRQLTTHVVRLTLKRAFGHASATRHQTENLLVRCELADGATGWGEGMPRSYVTGETPTGGIAQLARTPLAEQLAANCSSWPDVIRLCDSFAPTLDREDPRGCSSNALRCAVELSILDAYGRLFGEPVGAISRHVSEAASILEQRTAVQYSAVIDAGTAALWRKSLVRRLYGFRDCKVKVGAEGDDDVARLRTIRRWIGPRMDLRLDANEAWHTEEFPAKLEALSTFNISCIEQPVPHAEVGSLAAIRKQLGVSVMLDESLTSVADARAAIAGETCDLFNIRLSKCGGYLNSLRLAAIAYAAGVGYQLGCHPGESGILSAAGRHWACSVANTCHLEGSYDRHLLKLLLTNEDMTFGFGGWAPAIERAGLGITMNEAVLDKFTVSKQEFLIA